MTTQTPNTMAAATPAPYAHLPIFPADLMRMLGYKHRNSLRVAIRDKKVPPPDVQLSQKTRYWHKATLVNAGLISADGGSAAQ